MPVLTFWLIRDTAKHYLIRITWSLLFRKSLLTCLASLCGCIIVRGKRWKLFSLCDINYFELQLPKFSLYSSASCLIYFVSNIHILPCRFDSSKKNIFIFCSCFLFSQIEGAFIQGLGWAALEELKWGDGAHKWVPPGHLYTNGPGAYKIPSVNDVPLKFNVSLLKVCSWTLNIFFSSFLMGE